LALANEYCSMRGSKMASTPASARAASRLSNIRTSANSA